MAVSRKFTELKQRARRFYVGKTELEILQELSKYGESDISDMFVVDIGKTEGGSV
jgi:hypothetical protein